MKSQVLYVAQKINTIGAWADIRKGTYDDMSDYIASHAKYLRSQNMPYRMRLILRTTTESEIYTRTFEGE